MERVPPSVKAVNQLVGAPVESNVQLQCIVEAFPKPLNTWYRHEGATSSATKTYNNTNSIYTTAKPQRNRNKQQHNNNHQHKSHHEGKGSGVGIKDSSGFGPNQIQIRDSDAIAASEGNEKN
ncbi:hypothetical protein PVAND_006075 [Polypedilum vanderplanki]|uniref:Ig-like domain-containing protein n=1 Tax=Polypedilum vanderplanki TaxID=319348 RepID=A0A9J6C2H3_POLVA|nr:hypothetical protein PVAND_006075 [Polypedilum vanderplanki]